MTVTASPIIESASIGLAQLHVAGNVRNLDLAHVDALAGSIELQGVLQPVIVSPLAPELCVDGVEYELVAGFHRYAAAVKLGLPALPAIIRHASEQDTPADVAVARASENINRKNLDPYQEAIAVQAMLAKGFTEQGAAQALGWPAARVTARMKLLELPVQAQRTVGAGVLALSQVETLRGIGQVSRELLEVLIEFLAGNPEHVPSLGRDSTRLIHHALRESGSKVFVAGLTVIRGEQIEDLRLGKKTMVLYAELGELHKKLSPYSYGPPDVRFTDAEVDQARAAGVLIEGVGSPLIVDRSLYRELVKQATARQLEDTKALAAERAEQHRAERTELREQRSVDPDAQARREHGRRMRGLAVQAHGANTDLGWALRNNLATRRRGGCRTSRSA